jgi:hypothetical protein
MNMYNWLKRNIDIFFVGAAMLIVGTFIGIIMGWTSCKDGTCSKSNLSWTPNTQVTNIAPKNKTTLPLAPYTPIPEDFELNVIELERICYGSRGCNIDYRISVSQVGSRLPDPGDEWMIIYHVHGGAEPKTNFFTVREWRRFGFNVVQQIHTPPNPVLTAVPVRVIKK